MIVYACAQRSVSNRQVEASKLSFEARELERSGVSIRELEPDVLLAVQRSPNRSSANVLVVRVQDGSLVICSSP